MKKKYNSFNKKKHSLKFLIYIIYPIILFISISILISTAGCDKLNLSMFKSEVEESSNSSSQDLDNLEVESESVPGEDQKSNDDLSSSNLEADNAENTNNNEYNDYSSAESANEGSKDSDLEISKQREYFLEGLKYFGEESYLLAEYYFNKIKDNYIVLQDHILYYLAKSLLMQEKYDLAEENYLNLIQDFPDSIWSEKANLEAADLFFLTEDYLLAEEKYTDFLNNFAGSELIPYCLFQLAVCQEKNQKFDSAFENYRKIWFGYPANDYAQIAYDNIINLTNRELILPFTPTAEQIYSRGEIFFSEYLYSNAIEEFNIILGEDYISSLSAGLHSKALFKLGMCYYNLRDYSKSKDYLSLSYNNFPNSSYADDCLYFLGRVYTNLDLDDNAISYYQDLINKFPQSNFSDDGLYRLGRIYFFRDDYENASINYQRIINEYPKGDRIAEGYWELGWIQYRRSEWEAARNTFSGMANSFKGTSLGEKAIFWQAKCCNKIGENNQAIQLYKNIINLNSFSYYTFASRKNLEELQEQVQIQQINTSAYPHNPEIAKIIPDVYKDLEIDGSENHEDINHIEKAKELLQLELYTSASLEIEAGSTELEEDSVKILEVSTLYLLAKDYINSQKLISKYYSTLKSDLSSPYKDYFYYLSYPYGYKDYVDYYSAQNNIDPLFTLAVIREESRFQPEVGSFAGALGLMQIIPSTGQGIANQIGISDFDNSMLLDPETSIKMGTFYLRQQLNSFSENKFYTCGAYNGGPGAMSKWIANRGNKDIDEFIENIPYDETRNYIKKVMGSYYFYQILYP